MNVLIIGTDLNRKNDLKTQGQYLRDLLRDGGIRVGIASRFSNYFLRIMDTVWQILRLKKGDIIIVQVFSTMGIYLEGLSVLLGRLKRTTVISTFHGGNIPNIYQTNSVKRFILNKIINNSHEVTVPSKFISDNIPILKQKALLIHNYINIDQYHDTPKPNDKIRIFWMRSYHPTYDPLKAIKILEYLRSQNIEARLVMAGKDFGYLNNVLTYVKFSKYKDDIEIFGVLDNQAKNQIASQCTVYLCTNTIDNAPVSFIEMMAMGLPIVSTNVGGIPYYVEDRKHALLSSDNSVEDMADAIVRLHQNSSLRETLVANGLEFVKEFSPETVFQKWLTLLNTVHSKKRIST
jgi:glycosyltransferase involved in cell wall biosynthesis